MAVVGEHYPNQSDALLIVSGLQLFLYNRVLITSTLIMYTHNCYFLLNYNLRLGPLWLDYGVVIVWIKVRYGYLLPNIICSCFVLKWRLTGS